MQVALKSRVLSKCYAKSKQTILVSFRLLFLDLRYFLRCYYFAQETTKAFMSFAVLL